MFSSHLKGHLVSISVPLKQCLDMRIDSEIRNYYIPCPPAITILHQFAPPSSNKHLKSIST